MTHLVSVKLTGTTAQCHASLRMSNSETNGHVGTTPAIPRTKGETNVPMLLGWLDQNILGL